MRCLCVKSGRLSADRVVPGRFRPTPADVKLSGHLIERQAGTGRRQMTDEAQQTLGRS
jgi:hypothetical protein